jgi:CBS domain containing-hemolysin-like protein
MLELLVVLCLVIGLHAIVSAIEAALLSVPPSKVEAAKLSGKHGAIHLARLKDEIQKPLGSIIILTNTITVMGAFAVGVVATSRLGSVAAGIASVVLTILIIVFGETVPKILGERHAEAVSLFFARTLYLLTGGLAPFVNIAWRITQAFTHEKRAPQSSEEEIKAMAFMGARSGSIGSDEATMIQRVFRLNDITAMDLMTPRKRVIHLDGGKSLNELKEKIVSLRNSRIVVTGTAALDNVVGIAHQRDLLIALERGSGQELLLAFAKKPLFVPSDTHADELLHLFQRTRMHLGVVVNEHGEVVGVVTLEDCLEELVGEIIDEKDVVPELIKRISKDEIMAHGDTKGRYVNSFFQTSLPETRTLNGFLQAQLHRIPEKGEILYINDIKFTIEEAAGGEVQRVRLFRMQPQPAQTADLP